MLNARSKWAQQQDEAAVAVKDAGKDLYDKNKPFLNN